MITNDNELRTRAGGATVRAILWALAGALVMLFLVVDPLGVSPVDGWLGIERPADIGHGNGDGHGDGLWTCGMHPQVIEEEPGQCPICGMNLVPLREDIGHGDGDGHGDGLWTCPMHPEVLEEEPGSCPICGMDLVEVKEEVGHGDGDGIRLRPEGYAGTSGYGEREILFYRNPMDPAITSPVPRKDNMGMDYVPVYADEARSVATDGAVVTINPAVQQNMNVITERVTRRDISHRIRTVGYLDYDQEKMVSVTTKYPGFIEKTYVNYIGQPVRQGDPLFEIYAPELVQTEQELLSALRYATSLGAAPEETRRRAEALLEAARLRLSVTAPAGGVVMKRMPGLEGMAVRPGMELLHLADLSDLWLTVEIFEDQLPWLDVGSTATITMTYFPGETFHGRVRYIEPEVAQKTRTIQLTLEVPNRGSRLRVGMYATVIFEPVAAKDAIAVPSQAVLRTGERNVVIVALGDGRFAPREVRLGPQGGGFVQILEGLLDGDEIVTSAQFLIDSESNLREAIQKMIAAKREGGGQ